MNASCVAAFLSLAACAHVHQEYAEYDGPVQVLKGEGGTKTITDGVEFWTTGSPPRNYRVIGILSDQRRDQRFARASFGSDVADQVKRAGGDAVVYLDEAKEFVGTYSHASGTSTTTASATAIGNSAYGRSSTNSSASGFGIAVRNKITRLLVIKYVD